MRVFFSHASEDKALVEQVFLRVAERFPDIKGWLDKYEILGGDDLIDTIHNGIEGSDKFLIFLSPDSIDKPWVRTELRKAVMDEISGVKPQFIIPIKVGHISQFPPFLESRFYIDIEGKTQEEWLEDIYAAITRTRKATDQPADNLQIAVQIAADHPQAAIVLFEARFWAEQIGFLVTTTRPIKSTVLIFPTLKGMHQLSVAELTKERQFGIRIHDKTIRPKHPFAIGIEFETTGDPRTFIKSVDRWDGAGGEGSIRFMDFH